MSLRIENWGPKKLRPVDMVATPEGIHYAPEPDQTEHTDCFLCWANPTRGCSGWWWTNNIPLTTLTGDLNTTNGRVTAFKFNKLVRWSGPTVADYAYLLAESPPGTQIINATLAGTTVIEKVLNFDKLLDNQVKFGFYQYVQSPFIGWIEQHLWECYISGTYETSTPLQPRALTINVYDPVKAGPVAGALTQLLSGQALVDSGSTDNQGNVTLNGYNKIYTLKIMKSGYTPYPYTDDQIDMVNSNASVSVPLTYVGGGFELPWWWWVPIVAIVAIGGTWVIVKGLKPGRREPPVYVVR